MPEGAGKSSAVVAAVCFTLLVVALIGAAAKLGIDYGKQSVRNTPPEAMQAVRLAEQMPSGTPWALDYRIQSGRPSQQAQAMMPPPEAYSVDGIPPHYPRGLWSRYDIDFQRQMRAKHLPNGGMALPDGTYVPPNDATAWILQDMNMQNRLFDYYVNGGM